jgi:hypothetical protein
MGNNKRCSHGKRKDTCADCNPCPHGKLKSNCAECKGCPHGRVKYQLRGLQPLPSRQGKVRGLRRL